MKNKFSTWLSAACLSAAGLLPAVTLWGEPPHGADEPGRGSRIRPVPTDDAYILSWWGKTGETYFIQISPDLTSGWQYIDEIYSGQDALIEHGFSTNAPSLFFRLNYTDQATPDPENADFDGDGVSNGDELIHGTDPFKSDSDGDGMPDGWEITHGLDPLDPSDATADPDGDGFDNLTEYQAGLDPHDPANGVAGYSTDPAAPGRPAIVDGADLTTAALTWADNSDNELMFQIERAVNGGAYNIVATLPANTTSWTDSGLNPDNIYYYRVVSRNNAPLQQ